MKALFIADYLYVDMCGAKQSCLNHLRSLELLIGKENLIVIALTGNKQIKDSPFFCFSRSVARIHVIMNVLRGWPASLEKPMVSSILEIIKKNKIEAVFIDNSYYGHLSRAIHNDFPSIRIVSYYHDIKQELCRQWLKQFPKWKAPVLLAIINGERINQKYCDVNLTLNNRESQLFKKYFKRLPELELGVYLYIPTPKCIDTMFNIPIELLFIGKYYYPNVRGLKWFIENVIPILKIPYHLTVIGNGMEQIKNEITLPFYVSVEGKVESLESYYAQSDIVIGPIFEGGGMKVKTAEAFGYGKAFIGTQESFEGYDPIFQLEKEFACLCRTSQDFSEAIIRFSKALYLRKYNPEVRQVFEKFYSDSAAKDIFKQALNL